jgi:hypothetical protein
MILFKCRWYPTNIKSNFLEVKNPSSSKAFYIKNVIFSYVQDNLGMCEFEKIKYS